MHTELLLLTSGKHSEQQSTGRLLNNMEHGECSFHQVHYLHFHQSIEVILPPSSIAQIHVMPWLKIKLHLLDHVIQFVNVLILLSNCNQFIDIKSR